jgi:bacterioferritin
MSITPYTDEALAQSEVNQAMHRGPLTDAYQADVDWVINELNRLRATEVASYLQYKQHGYMAVSMLSPGIKADFEEHAAAELDHADRLAHRIQQLGGVPIYNPAELASKAADVGVQPEQAPTLTDMVIANLMLERQQIEAYTNCIRQIGDGDLVTRQVLIGILAETEGHAAELSDYLKLRSEMR